MSPYVIEIENLRKRREQAGTAFELVVPKLRIRKGGLAAILGDSGCGKSTLLDILALVSKPTACDRFEMTPDGDPESKIDINLLWEQGDEAILARIRRQHLGYVLQTGGLLPFLTVRENIQLPFKINGVWPDDERVTQLAERIGVSEVLNKKPQYLSGGERQRVAILRAIAHKPAIILADEPTAAVDKPKAKMIIKDLCKLAKENGTTILIVTHDHSLVEGLVDQVVKFTLKSIDRETHSIADETV